VPATLACILADPSLALRGLAAVLGRTRLVSITTSVSKIRGAILTVADSWCRSGDVGGTAQRSVTRDD
jgi:hypothetical protein